MSNRDDPKPKKGGSSSVVADDPAMDILSGDGANASLLDSKSVAPGTDGNPRDADENGENASGKGEEEKEPKEVDDEMEPRSNDETAIIVRPNGTESHADESFVDDKEEGMQPLEFHFPSSEYHKSLKLSGKCYIDICLSNIQTILKPKEVEWFIDHPQFQHFFHIKNQKRKWMGMWVLVVRSACVEKKHELWFIVNGVPIRYSLRELGLISGLYCHEYPPKHERLGGTAFKNKYFGGKRVTYADVEKQMLAMKSKPSEDRKKMAVLYFLASILVGGRKSGEGASPVDSFFLNVVEDLDACLTFPWGRYAFEHNLKDVSCFLDKCNGVAPTSWVFTSFPIALELLAFEAIPSLRNHFRENVVGARPDCPRMCKMQYKRKSGTKEFSLNAMNVKLGTDTKDIESILVAKTAEKELLETIGMDKEICWANDRDDASVDGWSKILKEGSTQVFFEKQFHIDCEARTAKIARPTDPIGEPSKNVKSGKAPADSVEPTGNEALKGLEARLTKAFQDAVKDLKKDLNKQSEMQSEKIALLEDKVKRLRSSGDNPLEDMSAEEEEDVDKESQEEEVAGDKESKESEEQVDDGYLLDITEEAEKAEAEKAEKAEAEKAEKAEAEKAEKVEAEKAEKAEKKKKRVRIDDGIVADALKKSKGSEIAIIPVHTRSMRLVEKAAKKEEAAKEAAAKEPAAKEAAAKKPTAKKAAAKNLAAKKAGKSKKTE